MKKSRLDKILLGLGYVTEDQILTALQKQQGLGGRFGTHLLYCGALSEEQLAHALALQFGVPAFQPAKHRIDPELVKKFPLQLIRQHQIMPLAYNSGNGVLSLVVVDPEDSRAVAEVTRTIRCSVIEYFITPEVTFESLVEQFAPDAGLPHDPYKQIELPELFAQANEDLPEEPEIPNEAAAATEAQPQVMLVSDQAFLMNFLGPIFAREGLELVPTVDPVTAAEQLKQDPTQQVLVAQEMTQKFDVWVRQGKVPRPRGEVTEFTTVSSALLENPISYTRLLHSLTESLRFMAEQHSGPEASTPPYDLLRNDVRTLAADLEMGRLASDGLELATLLIVPAHTQGLADLIDAVASGDSCGIDWALTLGHARALSFPWNVEGALQAFRELLSERVSLEQFATDYPELALAAQILAIVWHHYQDLGHMQVMPADRPQYLKAELRKKSGRLARSEVIESYVRLIEQNSAELDATANHQLFVVGQEAGFLTQFATRLRHRGYRPVRITELSEARQMCERQSPTAVFVHDTSYPDELAACPRLFKTQASTLVYAITTESDPSQVLNLFDAGFDDVFSLPRDVDIVSARLRKALKDVPDTTTPTPAPAPGQFQATFAALAFTDLLQALSQSQKSVGIKLLRSNGEQAVIHLDTGQLVHAICGDLKGSDAICRVITWEEDGEYRVEPVQEFPPANISMPLESVLMEGCRILDESRV